MSVYKQGAARLLGAETPLATANWPYNYSDTMYKLSDAPLVYNTVSGRFQPAFEGNASKLSISFPTLKFGRKKKKKSNKRSYRKRKRKTVRFQLGRSRTRRYGKKLRKYKKRKNKR